MNATGQLSCVMFGSDTLLIECAEIVLKQQHDIVAVATRSRRIENWARAKGIALLDLDADYQEQLDGQDFDYLLSITHLEIIPDRVLEMPVRGAINFHDGPLPRYAGLNAPVWALINQETDYGITWHSIVPGVDEGDILKQLHFTIAADETALSINTRCFAAALDTFPELLQELTAGTASGQPQNLAERSYYAKFKRPPNAGVLDWEQSAASLESLVRALDFGDYANPMASPKVFYRGVPTIVAQARAGEESALAKPGSIIGLDDDAITVATGRGVLRLAKLLSLRGDAVSIAALVEQHGLAVGTHFDRLPPQDLTALSSLNERLCRQEDYWCQRLSALEPIEIPYAAPLAAGAPERVASMDFTFDGSARQAVAGFALLLARLAQKYRFDLSYSDDSLRQQVEGLEVLVSDAVVLSLNIDAAGDSGSQQLAIASALEQLAERGTWLRDLVARHKELRAIPELNGGGLLPIGVVVSDCIEPVTLGRDNALILALSSGGTAGRIVYDPSRFSPEAIGKLKDQLIRVTRSIIDDPGRAVAAIELLTDGERQRVLVDWNDTQTAYSADSCIHTAFEQRVALHPEKTALIFEDQALSYRELNERANRLAHYLRVSGVGADDRVGVNIERSLALMVATLGILKAGAAYVPLDPAFPAERLQFMVEDTGMPVILTGASTVQPVSAGNARVICLDRDWPAIAACAGENLVRQNAPDNLAYVIYTSGSTGKPKGVMVEHRNAVNFFAGMDQRIVHDDDSTWLAVTSLSFDISVLELFWTLTRGLRVVIHQDSGKLASGDGASPVSDRPMDFGLFMWGNDDAPGSSKYRLMLEGAKYFDEHGFDAVWTPERHFGAFGGPFPNPAVTSAALATVTSKIQIRSGSCVSPLHHPIRIAEDWAVVDNLSDGRVGLSFAAGWQPNDFVIMPQNHANNKAVMFEQIDTVRKLWRGEKVAFENPMGEMVDTLTLPRPVQKELPVWLTTAGNPESYRQAGEKGCNVLTHLLGQTVEELAEKIAIYRAARQQAGLDPAEGKVSLMLHTFVGDDVDAVRERVREPMKDYLRSSMKLVIDFAWSFPAFKRPGGSESTPRDIDLKSLSEEDAEVILDFAFERYFETSGLFGTPDVCLAMIDRCKRADVNEIACLLDFGVETNAVLDSLPLLKQVRDRANMGSSNRAESFSLPEQVARHQVTHLQCTPSHAHMLTLSSEGRTALASIAHMMVGGEALAPALAKDLKGILTGTLTNMYGPTETTIWSTTQRIDDPSDITIGRPIANTRIYILDAGKQPVPIGVTGDLYIAGDGVVRGYLNRAELTAERFVPDPFQAGGDRRMYWTGDCARYRADGTIEFLGRIDHQIKIRGYRVELGEIEASIAQLSQIRDCVTVLREDTPGDQRLVAYLIARSGGEFDTASLKAHLRAQLPDYMVPAEFIVLDAFPLTPNGKLDRQALPSPQGIEHVVAEQFVPPGDELEVTIAKLWQDTLKLEQVGINDNFFDLGGHSLLIVSIHSQLKGLIDYKVSLTDLYGYPTIRSLAQFLTAGGDVTNLQKSSARAERRRKMMGRRRR